MDLTCVPAMLVFPLVVTVISERPLVLHHWNQNESLRFIRSATSKNSLDQARTQSVVSCYGSQCVLNEQFCNATTQKCAMCHYGNGECTTTNSDCFNFCSEKKAQEICTGQEGHTENTELPWWTYLLAALFIGSIAANVCCIIKRYKMWRKGRGDFETKMMQTINIDVNHDSDDTDSNSPQVSSQDLEPIITHPESDYPQISPTGP